MPRFNVKGSLARDFLALQALQASEMRRLLLEEPEPTEPLSCPLHECSGRWFITDTIWCCDRTLLHAAEILINGDGGRRNLEGKRRA